MMTVERRYSARHSVSLPVYIRYRKRRFLTARARDLSVGGMFLAVQSLTLPTGTPIELEFRGLGRSWLLPAIVIHGDNSGIGVVFRDPQPELFRGLTQAVAATPLPVLSEPTAELTCGH
jgi:hypothetical protein